jgi:hypothetical protein
VARVILRELACFVDGITKSYEELSVQVLFGISIIANIIPDLCCSAECIDEAKRRVYSDPESNRSWNLCWLVLNKIQNE